jgi:hypothetical protein
VAGIWLRKLWNKDRFSRAQTKAILARGNIAIHVRLKGEMSEACIGLEPKGWAYVASLIKDARATGVNVLSMALSGSKTRPSLSAHHSRSPRCSSSGRAEGAGEVPKAREREVPEAREGSSAPIVRGHRGRQSAASACVCNCQRMLRVHPNSL